MLYGLTVWVNFVSLLLVLWLGLYLVTRSAHRPQAWLSALALWSTSGIFLNQLLALHPPPAPPPEAQAWVYHLILFWPRNVFELGWLGWLQGWLPAYGIPFWYHASLYFRPGVFNRSRQVGALLGYGVALVGILFKVRYLSPWIDTINSPLYSRALPFPFSILYSFGFGFIAVLSLVNLAQAANASTNAMPRRLFRLLLGAALLAAAAGLPGIMSSWFGTLIPQVWMALLLLAALLLGGAGIAQYHALLDHRSLWRDMLYSAVEAAAVLGIYLLFQRAITLLYPLPFITFVFVGCLAIFSHLLIDIARVHYDTLFSHGKNRLLGFRQPGGISDHRGDKKALELALETLIDVTGATWVVVLRFTQQGMKFAAAWNWAGAPLDDEFAVSNANEVQARDTFTLDLQQLPPPLDQAALILPLYQREQEQTGVLLVGASSSQIGFSQDEINALQNSRKVIAGLVGQPANRGEPRLSSESGDRMVRGEGISPRLVELGLRNLHDYAYLADSPLANLRLVLDCADGNGTGTNIFINRGKALSFVLSEAVTKLKPDPVEPSGAPPRSWYPYLILKNAYLEDVQNREIMARLYISEGTFNRTRRAAIQSVARILEEMESNLEGSSGIDGGVSVPGDSRPTPFN